MGFFGTISFGYFKTKFEKYELKHLKEGFYYDSTDLFKKE